MTEDRSGHLSILVLSLTSAYTILYTEFTGAGEEKCMPDSASVNTVQGTVGGLIRARFAEIHRREN